MPAAEIPKKGVRQTCSYSSWQWQLDEEFVKINGETHYLWHTVDHDGEILKSFVATRCDCKAALKFLRKTMKRYGRSYIVVTDEFRHYHVAIRVIGNDGVSAVRFFEAMTA